MLTLILFELDLLLFPAFFFSSKGFLAFLGVFHCAAKGGREKGIGKKNSQKVKKVNKSGPKMRTRLPKVTEKECEWPTPFCIPALPTPFCRPPLRHSEFPHLFQGFCGFPFIIVIVLASCFLNKKSKEKKIRAQFCPAASSACRQD